jgi:hypothetical protein
LDLPKGRRPTNGSSLMKTTARPLYLNITPMERCLRW